MTYISQPAALYGTGGGFTKVVIGVSALEQSKASPDTVMGSFVIVKIGPPYFWTVQTRQNVSEYPYVFVSIPLI